MEPIYARVPLSVRDQLRQAVLPRYRSQWMADMTLRAAQAGVLEGVRGREGSGSDGVLMMFRIPSEPAGVLKGTGNASAAALRVIRWGIAQPHGLPSERGIERVKAFVPAPLAERFQQAVPVGDRRRWLEERLGHPVFDGQFPKKNPFSPQTLAVSFTLPSDAAQRIRATGNATAAIVSLLQAEFPE